MEISEKWWTDYVRRLSAISSEAGALMQEYLDENLFDDDYAMIEYAYALATRYGEAAAALACEMYDSVADASGLFLPPAEPAPTATFEETAKAVRGTMKNQRNSVPATVSRLTKQAAADTTLRNAARDGAQFAWVPHGDTCGFCLMLASNGWQNMSRKALKNGHAEHIHAHCDCEYAVRFDDSTTVEGYDENVYKQIWADAEGSSWQEKLASLQEQQYAKYYERNKETINARKRVAYAERKEQEKGLTTRAGNGSIQSSKVQIQKVNRSEPDIQIPFGVGAKAKDVFVELPNRERVTLTPGTRITNIEIIAGKGRNRKIDEIDGLLEKFPGTDESEWQKKKGIGFVNYQGESYRANIHWYEEPSVGRVKYKVKPDADGNWFYDD